MRVIFADPLKLKINYKALIKNSKFNYNYKPYVESGYGGRGQYILREYYDKLFLLVRYLRKKGWVGVIKFLKCLTVSDKEVKQDI